MNSSIKKEERTVATLIHLSVFSMFLVPLGNFIFPLILWLTKKESEFVDHHGRQALNFQISLFLYSVLLVGIALAIIIFTGFSLSGDELFFITPEHFPFREFSQALPFILIIGSFVLLSLGLFILSIFAVISASLNASEEKFYNYPLSINFLGASKNNYSSNHHQSKNEQFNNPQNQRL